MKKLSGINIHAYSDNIKYHRYASIDDWWNPTEQKDKLLFKVVTADMGNMDYNFLVLLHAMIEQYLCYKHWVKDEVVMKWDKEHLDAEEPGALPGCPYHKEHEFATNLEAQMSVELKVSWDRYGEKIDEIVKQWHNKK